MVDRIYTVVALLTNNLIDRQTIESTVHTTEEKALSLARSTVIVYCRNNFDGRTPDTDKDGTLSHYGDFIVEETTEHYETIIKVESALSYETLEIHIKGNTPDMFSTLYF